MLETFHVTNSCCRLWVEPVEPSLSFLVKQNLLLNFRFLCEFFFSHSVTYKYTIHELQKAPVEFCCCCCSEVILALKLHTTQRRDSKYDMRTNFPQIKNSNLSCFTKICGTDFPDRTPLLPICSV